MKFRRDGWKLWRRRNRRGGGGGMVVELDKAGI